MPGADVPEAALPEELLRNDRREERSNGELVTRDAVTPPGFSEKLSRLYQTTLEFALGHPETKLEDYPEA